MDEDGALAPTADDNTGLAPEVRAELQSLAQDVRETISRAWSDHTHRAYAGAWRRFGEWASARGLQTLPAEPATLLLHLQDLAGKGKATSVISAIRATARTPRRGRGGRMENSETAEARARVDVALALTLRDGGLRVSEAAALTWKDVERWADGSGRLTILRSKTDQEGKGAVVAVTPACLRALDAIRPENPGDGDRVFRLSIRQMANRIKDAVATAGFDGDVFSGHSGRVGLARMMSGAGAPTETTMRQGRWKSAEMVRRYTRAETAGAALQWMDGGT